MIDVAGAQREERKLRSLDEAALLVRGIPPTVSQLRDSVFALRDAAAREDITVAQAREAKTKLSETEKLLVQTCAHPFVLEQDGYTGSSSMDNDDSYPAQRGCIVCNAYEVEIDYAQRRTFEILKDLKDRYVLRLTAKRDGLSPALKNLSEIREASDLIQWFVTIELQRYLDTLDANET